MSTRRLHHLWSAGGVLLTAAALAPAAGAAADATLATGLAPTVKVSMHGTAVAWSAPAPTGGFKLVIRRNGVASGRLWRRRRARSTWTSATMAMDI